MTLLCVFSFGGHCCICWHLAVALMPKTVTRRALHHQLLERMGVSATKIEGGTFVDGEIYRSPRSSLSAGHFSSMLLTVVITMLQLAFFTSCRIS
ncbi:MAG: hypothetical protein ACLU37_08075 [Collinsella sp.]